jgi:hypothetical protein
MFGKNVLLTLASSIALPATAMALALLKADTTAIIATIDGITARDSGVCDPSHGRPGAFLWCRQEDWRDCYYEPPSDTCWSFDSDINIPRSLGPDPGGYCVFYQGHECVPPVVSVIAPHEPGVVER